MKWKIILFMMVMLMLELVHASPSISVDITSNDTYNTSNSIFNLTLTGNGECNGGNTSWWNSTGKQQILGLDFNINETDGNFWDYTGDTNTTCTNCPVFNISCGVDGSGCIVFKSTTTQIKTVSSISNVSNFSSYSVSFWLNIHNNDGSSGSYTVYRNNLNNNDRNGFVIVNKTNELRAGIYDGIAYVKKASSSVTLNRENWYYIVITYNITNFKMYINSSLQSGTTQPGLGTGNYFEIGDSVSSGNFSIDDMRVLNYALSAQEVSEQYNASVARRSPRLLPEQTTNGDIWQASAVCSNGTAYSTRASEILYISDCITLLANTSYAAWLNLSACDFYDHLSQSTNFTTYDTNNCGTFSNITYNLTQNASCDFCEDNQNISLCTYQTNEMEGRNMLFGLILIPLVLGIMFLVASFLMSEEHTIIKIFFFGLSFLSATASLYMGSVGITYIDPADTAVQAAIGNMMQWVSWVDYIILIYIFIFVTIHILKALKQDKEEKLKY